MPDLISKKKKVPKFVLAKNEAAAPGATYIVHTQEPSFIGEIRTFDSLLERDAFIEVSGQQEIITVTSTTVLIVLKYLESPDKAHKRDFLDKRVVHWIIANCLNNSVLGGDSASKPIQ